MGKTHLVCLLTNFREETDSPGEAFYGLSTASSFLIQRAQQAQGQPDLGSIDNYSLVPTWVCTWKLLGSLPSWGIMIFFSSQGKPDCQSHLLSLRQSFTYIAKQSRWTFIHGGNPSNQRSKSPACKRQTVHNIYMVTGLWPPCGDERSMYSLVAQLVEHLKLNQEVPGSLPGWGIMIFFSSQGKPDCQSHLLSLRQSFTWKLLANSW